MTTLLLLPGMHGSDALFGPLIACLPATLRPQTVCYPAQARLSYAELAGWVDAALPPAGDVMVLGESFSGPVATLVAARLRARARALVLVCSFVRAPRPWLSPMVRLVPDVDPSFWPARWLGRVMYGRWNTPERTAALARALEAVPAATIGARLRAAQTVDVSAALAACRAPVCYLRARQDRVVPASASRRVARIAGTARVIDLDGPHGLLQVHPRAVAAVLADLMSEAG